MPAPALTSAPPVSAGHPQGVSLRQRWPLVLTGLLALIAAFGLVWFAIHHGPLLLPEPKPVGSLPILPAIRRPTLTSRRTESISLTPIKPASTCS